MEFNARVIRPYLRNAMNNISNDVDKRFRSLTEEEKEKYFKDEKLWLSIWSVMVTVVSTLMFVGCLIGIIAMETSGREYIDEDAAGLAGLYFMCILGFIGLIIALPLTIFYRRKPYSDEWVKSSLNRLIKIEKRNNYVSNQQVGDEFDKQVTLSIEGGTPPKLLINSQSSQFRVQAFALCTKTYNFSDIISYEIYENKNSVVKGTAGKALVGGVFFGLGGAIVGSSMSRGVETNCNELKLMIRVNDITDPLIIVTYVENGLLNKESDEYKRMRSNLQEVCSYLEYMTNNTKEMQPQPAIEQKTPILNKKEELEELKNLVNSGLISEEDYEKSKNKILGI